MTQNCSGVPDYFQGCLEQHLHFSNQTVLHVLKKKIVLGRTVDNKNKKDCFSFFEYVNQLLLILSPFIKVLLKYWWWQLLPSSLLGKMKSGVTWFGPLRTNSVFIVSMRCAGQSAGSVGSGSSVFAASGGHAKSTLSHLICTKTSHTHIIVVVLKAWGGCVGRFSYELCWYSMEHMVGSIYIYIQYIHIHITVFNKCFQMRYTVKKKKCVSM